MKNIFLLLLITFSLGACKKYYNEKADTLHQLYKLYANGAIDECKYQGEKVYCAQQNMYDAAAAIYNANGKQIGTCNFAWGKPDSICFKLDSCETIYRIKDNIWGQPAVDKYGLGK